jgi:hypothetical protein
MMTQAELMLALRHELERHPALDFALLFGSWARGHARLGSDVDVAIMPIGDWPLSAELDLQSLWNTPMQGQRSHERLVTMRGASMSWESLCDQCPAGQPQAGGASRVLPACAQAEASIGASAGE